jgi:anti-sigma B factor antagonist
MSLDISTREVTDVLVVDMAGRVTLGEATGKLRDTIRDLIAKDYKKILLNLEKLEYMDSAGLGELVGAYTTVKNAGGALKMLKVQGRALDLMQVTKLMTLFEFFDDEGDAVKSYG